MNPAPICYLDSLSLRSQLSDGAEIALIDVREPGQYGEGHPFLAVNLPYSRLELDAIRLLPRLDVRIVLIDADDGVAQRAHARLTAAGYGNLAVLTGGAPAWPASGCALFKGVNVPSKTFGELVEQICHTPHLSAIELQGRLLANEPVLLVDGRTPAEHRKMTLPGALPIPNGELALRIPALLTDTSTPVVIHCAGRTRSIIGAQTLRHLGLTNPVLALENGTQGWRLAGLDLEHDSPRTLPPKQQSQLKEAARHFAARAGAPELDTASAQAWLDDRYRSTYVFDIRSAKEYEAGTLPGALHAPGGQLIQATDQYVAVRHARILVLDDEGVRAPTVAAWLRQLGFESATLSLGIHAPLKISARSAPYLPPLPWQLDSAEMRSLIEAGARIIDLRASLAYRAAHLQGARWSIRPRLAKHAENMPMLLIADNPALAALAVQDLHESGAIESYMVDWQTVLDSGLPIEASPDLPSDDDAIDYLFFVHDRHDGNLDAARRYLEWETGLISQCMPNELAIFNPLPPDRPSFSTQNFSTQNSHRAHSTP
ncbi:rhodanese-like domain-containing protein [Uliginosibacterium gangwonense]|uniref:rhodanese-like domain-containing protein n=1 Tax=Uliginosibacterium gangwonense TaxID=392736 RepID=UPI00035EAABA|nr:rhodanese-like domain-containing protein [Uliginosibacterium gangwonense]